MTDAKAIPAHVRQMAKANFRNKFPTRDPIRCEHGFCDNCWDCCEQKLWAIVGPLVEALERMPVNQCYGDHGLECPGCTKQNALAPYREE